VSGRLFTYNLRFPGQYYDAETGKHYNYFRDYDAAIGRFLESDPIGMDGGTDTFGYGLLAPLNMTDSTGLLPDGCMTCTVYAEAGGSSDECQHAVASVIRNRMADGRHFRGQTTACSVVSATRQFDGFGTGRYNQCLTGCPEMSKRERWAADRSFFNSDSSDNTNNSVFFHDRSIRTPPDLSRRMRRGEVVEYRVPGCRSLRFYRFIK
jgi:RHS repeat-associated protein